MSTISPRADGLAGAATPSAIYNVTDDEPGPPQDVITFAAELTGLEPPPEIPFEQAALADGGELLWREQARLERAGEAGIRLCLPLSDLSRGLRALAAAGE
jgi:hypothetical protein